MASWIRIHIKVKIQKLKRFKIGSWRTEYAHNVEWSPRGSTDQWSQISITLKRSWSGFAWRRKAGSGSAIKYSKKLDPDRHHN
jgi:hypothetical protein